MQDRGNKRYEVALERKTGDCIKINGDYQFRALMEGNPVQRFWHYNKQLAIKTLMPPNPGEYVIDVGCGSGVITSFLGESGADVLGIDGNTDAIRFAQRKFSKAKVRFKLGLVDDNLIPEKPVDKIYCLEVIEHIYRHQTEKMLIDFMRILRPGGLVFLTTPNYRSLWPVIEFFMDRLGTAPRMSEDQHVKFYNMKKLAVLCRSAGFKIDLLTTTCFLAPWLAPLSWKLAERIAQKEYRLSFLPGSILICILEKKHD